MHAFIFIKMMKSLKYRWRRCYFFIHAIFNTGKSRRDKLAYNPELDYFTLKARLQPSDVSISVSCHWKSRTRLWGLDSSQVFVKDNSQSRRLIYLRSYRLIYFSWNLQIKRGKAKTGRYILFDVKRKRQ